MVSRGRQTSEVFSGPPGILDHLYGILAWIVTLIVVKSWYYWTSILLFTQFAPLLSLHPSSPPPLMSKLLLRKPPHNSVLHRCTTWHSKVTWLCPLFWWRHHWTWKLTVHWKRRCNSSVETKFKLLRYNLNLFSC